MEYQAERRHLGASQILQSGKSWGWGRVSNIKPDGCYIETMHPLPVGTEAQLRLTIDGILLDICANVVSIDPMFGMGMNFACTGQWKKLTQSAASRRRVRVAIAFKKIKKVTDVELSPEVSQNKASRWESITFSRLLH